MPDFTQTIDNFNGEVLGTKAMDWLQRLESTALLHKWPQEIKLETAKVHLVGAAKKWFTDKAGDITDFQDFKYAFKKTFYIKQSKDETWEKMRRRYQGKNESIFSYFHDKVTLCKALDFDYAEIKEQVVVGLYNKHIIPGVIASQADNVDDLLHEIINFDRITGKAQHSSHSNAHRFINKSNPSENVRPMQTRNPIVKQESSSTAVRLPERSEDGKPLCFICKKYGHVSRYCRLRTTPKCFRCQKEGHLLRDCPEPREAPKEDGAVSQPSQFIVGRDKNNGEDPVEKYVREISIGDKKLQAFIDPGSAVCTIKEKIVREMKLLCEPTHEKLNGFGESVTISYWQTKLQIRIDNVEAEVTTLVVPDIAQPVDVMLGRSFTELPNVAYVKMG